jgi:hypothetical protein
MGGELLFLFSPAEKAYEEFTILGRKIKFKDSFLDEGLNSLVRFVLKVAGNPLNCSSQVFTFW